METLSSIGSSSDILHGNNSEVLALSQALERYDNVYVVVSPPRCSSTAFSRVLWEHPAIDYYNHEPFAATYHKGLGLDDVLARLQSPLSLQQIRASRGRQDKQAASQSLVIKEMTFQVGQYFSILTALTQKPIVFLLRDPRLSIASRMVKKQEGGDSPIFPVIESGWESLLHQVRRCQQLGLPHMLVDATEFRNHPEYIFGQVFHRLGLSFDRKMLSWQPCPDVNINDLDGEQRHFYNRVLTSQAIQPATEPIPSLQSFPDRDGLRKHVADCLDIYKSLCESPERISCSR